MTARMVQLPELTEAEYQLLAEGLALRLAEAVEREGITSKPAADVAQLFLKVGDL